MAISYNNNGFIVNCCIQKGSRHYNNIPLFSIFKVSMHLIFFFFFFVLTHFSLAEYDMLINSLSSRTRDQLYLKSPWKLMFPKLWKILWLNWLTFLWIRSLNSSTSHCFHLRYICINCVLLNFKFCSIYSLPVQCAVE
jgi:hypothetical protein